MRSLQRSILIAGTVLIAATTFVAPYTVRGVNQIAVAAGTDGGFEYTAYAPLWSSPERDAAQQLTTSGWDVQLDAGRLGIWWAGIVLLTLALLALTAERRSSAPEAARNRPASRPRFPRTRS